MEKLSRYILLYHGKILHLSTLLDGKNFMTRRYYSSRKNPKSLSLDDLHYKFIHIYLYFSDKDYFKGKAGITSNEIPEEIKHKAAISLSFNAFPLTEWDRHDVTEDHIFDAIEFLYDHVSSPGEWVGMTSETGFNYHDYDGYDEIEGKKEYREYVNSIICDYKDGYELSEAGIILSAGKTGLQYIFDAEIEPYDEDNVDNKVKEAILKWRNRHLEISERRQAIREMADVFEWLKKTKKLARIMNKKDESALFEIANKFHIRHHDPNQKREYDESIWYSWIFHFYLATYHAVIRFLKKDESK